MVFVANVATTCCCTLLLACGWLLGTRAAPTTNGGKTWPPSWLSNSPNASWNLLRMGASPFLTTLRTQRQQVAKLPERSTLTNDEEKAATQLKNVFTLLGWPAATNFTETEFRLSAVPSTVPPDLTRLELEDHTDAETTDLSESPRVVLLQRQTVSLSPLSSSWALLPSVSFADKKYHSILMPAEDGERFSLGRFQHDNRDCATIEQKSCDDSWAGCRCYGAYRCNKNIGKCERLQSRSSVSRPRAPFFDDDEVTMVEMQKRRR